MNTEKTLFGKMKLSDLMEEVYLNSRRKNRQIDSVIDTLKSAIKTTGSVGPLTELIATLITCGIKNDEVLVKLTVIAQRLIALDVKHNVDSVPSDFVFSEEERSKLLEELNSVGDEVNNILNSDAVEDIRKKYVRTDSLENPPLDEDE